MHHKTSWLTRRRQKRRLKRQRTGDTPQKLAERRRRPERDVTEAIARTGEIGFISGAF
jgi:hypothetical protein